MAKQTKQSREITAPPRSWLSGSWSEMDRMFEDFFDRRFPSFPRLLTKEERMGFLTPRVDIKENDKAIVVSAELPGLEESDVDVSLQDGMLTLKGEKKIDAERKDDNYRVTERRYGSFQRSFRLPDSVDEGKVSASFDKGVLTIDLPKRAEAVRAAKKIKIARKSAAK